MPAPEAAAGASRPITAPLCLVPAPETAPGAATSAAPGATRPREATREAARRAGAARPSPGSPPSPRLQRAVRPRPKPAPPRPPAPSAPAPGYAPAAKVSGEWAFLDDKRLSVEEKLFRFMKLTAQKSDKELVDKMKEYKARFTSAAKAAGAADAKAKGPSSLFGVLKALVPALGIAEKVIGIGGLQKAAGVLGGPALAGLATALGLPQLAPIALKHGGDLAQLAFKAVGSAASSSEGTSAPAAGEAGSPDERIAMMELQRLVEKQQQMFTAISNAMRAMHDTQMAAIHNIR